MRVRIIAGSFGGRFLDTPKTSTTHPMSERARAAIFSSLGGVVAGARVLDAFAGSGAIGLEAFSRGAQHVTFLEKNRVAAKIIRENCTTLKVSEAAIDVINTTVNNWIVTASPEEYDIIFADPPYHNPQLNTIKTLMGLLKVGGYMVLSHTGRCDVEINSGIVVVDNRSYANAHVTFYHRTG